MKNPSTWRVPLLAWLPVSAAIIAETVSNGLRAYGLGTHLEKFTVSAWGTSVSLAGAVLVLAAVAVSLSQARAAWLALMPGPWRQRIPAGFAAVLLLAVSITAMASHILEAERAKVGAEGGQSGAYDRTLADYNAKKTEFDTLSNVRSIETIKAALDAAPVPRNVFRRTAECTDVTLDDSFAACKPILDLRQEMGSAIRKRSIEPEVASLKAALNSQPKIEVASATEVQVGWWWGWLMGVAVVFIATFGAVIWAKPSGDSTTATTDSTVENQRVTTATAAIGDWQADYHTQGELPSPAMFSGEQPDPPPSKKRKPSRRAKKRDDVIAKIRAHTLRHGSPPSFTVVRSRHRLSNGSAHRYLKQALA